ncbi:hypothetical protein CRENBAI_019763 [Crenichthys baileyi]|uniref:HECT domain-containing protein n=1 Tax=Crenichthys baileyi TaxID=28760 RepID=A0AAV9SP05_9TELE
MDDFMQAEGPVDEVGPTQEFFRLPMMAVKDGTLFTGSQNSKNLSLDSHEALQKPLRYTNITAQSQRDRVFEITLEQILVFASGADKVSPLGCSPQPTLNFIHEAGLKYPEANTCLVNFKLPIQYTYRQFTKFMYDGIIQAPIFGLA